MVVKKENLKTKVVLEPEFIYKNVTIIVAAKRTYG